MAFSWHQAFEKPAYGRLDLCPAPQKTHPIKEWKLSRANSAQYKERYSNCQSCPGRQASEDLLALVIFLPISWCFPYSCTTCAIINSQKPILWGEKAGLGQSTQISLLGPQLHFGFSSVFPFHNVESCSLGYAPFSPLSLPFPLSLPRPISFLYALPLSPHIFL